MKLFLLLVLPLSKHTQAREKKRQYAISLVTLSKDPSNRLQLVKDGCIDTLIELSQLDDGQVKRSCAAAFSYLAAEPQIRNRMVDEGCIGAALFHLSGVPSETIQSDVARAVCNLCNSHGSEAKAIRDGATIIVSHIASQSPETLDICISALLNLSCVPDRYSKIEEINDAILLINALPSLTETQDELILSTLCNLSALRGNQLRLVEDGCIKIVERLMLSTNAKIRALASEVPPLLYKISNIYMCITIVFSNHSNHNDAWHHIKTHNTHLVKPSYPMHTNICHRVIFLCSATTEYIRLFA